MTYLQSDADDAPVVLRRMRATHRGGRKPNTSMPLGKRMVACGLGVGDLAALAGISERQLSNYLAGRKCPSDTDLIYLSRVLKCRVEDITPPR